MATGMIRTATATTREVVPIVSVNKAQSRSNVLAVYKEMLVRFIHLMQNQIIIPWKLSRFLSRYSFFRLEASRFHSLLIVAVAYVHNTFCLVTITFKS